MIFSADALPAPSPCGFVAPDGGGAVNGDEEEDEEEPEPEERMEGVGEVSEGGEAVVVDEPAFE